MRFLIVLAMAFSCALTLSAQPDKALDARRAQFRDAIQAEWEYTPAHVDPSSRPTSATPRYNDQLGRLLAAKPSPRKSSTPSSSSSCLRPSTPPASPTTRRSTSSSWCAACATVHRRRKVQRLADAGEPVRRSAPRLRIHAVADAIHLGEGLRELHCAAAPDSAGAGAGHGQHEARHGQPADAAEVPAGESGGAGAERRRRSRRQESVHPAGAEVSRRHFRRRPETPARGSHQGREDGNQSRLREVRGLREERLRPQGPHRDGRVVAARRRRALPARRQAA